MYMLSCCQSTDVSSFSGTGDSALIGIYDILLLIIRMSQHANRTQLDLRDDNQTITHICY